VFADTKEQRCWWHKIGNVLAALPKSAHKDTQGRTGGDLQRRRPRPRRAAAKAFASAYGAKWPEAVAKITNDLDALLACYVFPGEHWIHLRTTNPIESAFATVRLRRRVTKRHDSRAAGIAMAFKTHQVGTALLLACRQFGPSPRAGQSRREVRERRSRRTTRRISKR
jgi:transposase-like protein